MKIVCDNCSTKYSIADEKVRGKVFKIKCKKCSHIIVVKGSEGEAAADPVPQPGFDQKETRVFDYSGFDGKEGAGAPQAAAAAEPIWHLVIDREQVGPLSIPEVQAKWAAGEVDAETYAWREGFGDWQRIGAIDELNSQLQKGAAAASAVAASPAPAAGAGAAGLFGEAAAATGRSDPADLFGAAAPPSGEEDAGGGADLFGAQRASEGAFADAEAGGGALAASAVAPPVARRSVPKDDLFAASNGGGGGFDADVGAAASPRVDVRPMTGQRNENSVLFSLNNLAALATETPKSGGGGGGGGGMGGPAPGFQSGGGSEGSGLIDIRAMAAMTLGAKKDDVARGPGVSASEDDLPVFSSNAFAAPAAGVLLPSVQPASTDRKLLYILMGVVGLLLVAAAVLLVFVLKSPKATETASNDGTTKVAGAGGGGGGEGGDEGGNRPKDPAVVPPGPGTGTDPGTDVKPPDPGTPGTDVKSPTNPTPGTDKKPDDRKPDRKPDDKKPDRKPDDKKPDDKKPDDKPPPDTGGSCDEVTCAIEPDKPCCKRRGGGSNPKPPSGDSNLPDSLGRSDISNGMNSVRGRVNACFDQYKVPGQVDVKLVIDGDGKVTSATVVGKFAGTPTGSCVERAVKNAKFKKWKGPSVTVKYPFVFR